MLMFIFGVLLAALALGTLSVQKTYQQVPAKELRRLARSGDQVAELFYRPVAYGLSLKLVLWLIAGMALAGSGLLFAKALPGIFALLITAIVIWLGFVWIPTGRLTKPSLWTAKQTARPLAWLLERLQPVTRRLTSFIRSHRPVTIHTGLYDKADIAELLEQQKAQPDNRIVAGEIELLQHALSFGDKLVADTLIPKRVVHFVNADDTIGPALMAELHQKGHSRFPVYEGKRDQIVGILYLHDLVTTKQTGVVRDIMKAHVTYVHEDFTLYQTLQAFLKTKQQLFLVVNSFEELVGIITIEDVIEQIIGQPILDEFDEYDDLRAVATAAAAKDHQTKLKTNTEAQEVVE